MATSETGGGITDAIQQLAHGFKGSPSVPPEGGASAEAYLIETQIAEKSSIGRRRILSCLGCQLKCGDSPSGEIVYAIAVEQCSGVAQSAISRTLGELSSAGMLEAEQEQRVSSSHPRTFYRIADTSRGKELFDRLEAPAVCRRNGGEIREEPNAQAEQLLIEAGLFKYATAARRAVLGCLACQLSNAKPGETKARFGIIANCAGKEGGSERTVLRMFATLTDAGILVRDEASAPSSSGLGRRSASYGIQYTDLGLRVAILLEPPDTCGKEPERNAEQDQ
jgi:DNA-binding transcriptional ArsR family regulator